jgi:flagellar biosynthetic protein FliR
VSLSIDPRLFMAFLLASTRCVAWLSISPPFKGMVPAKVRAGLGLALGVALAPRLAHEPHLPIDDFGSILAGFLYQVGIGLALGFVVYLVFQAVQAAGASIDYFSGLTSAQLFDPMTGHSEGPMTRFYNLIATVVLFVTGGHLLLVAGIVRSFDAAPVGGLHVDRLAAIISSGVGNFLLAALQIGAPLLGALFVTELLLSLASRAAPQLNILVLGFGAKSLVLVTVSTIAIPLLVAVIPRLTGAAVDAMWQLVR